MSPLHENWTDLHPQGFGSSKEPMTDDLVTQIRHALAERAARIQHAAGCVSDSEVCACDYQGRIREDAARAIAAALESTAMAFRLEGHLQHKFVAALRQEAP